MDWKHEISTVPYPVPAPLYIGLQDKAARAAVVESLRHNEPPWSIFPGTDQAEGWQAVYRVHDGRVEAAVWSQDVGEIQQYLEFVMANDPTLSRRVAAQFSTWFFRRTSCPIGHFGLLIELILAGMSQGLFPVRTVVQVAIEMLGGQGLLDPVWYAARIGMIICYVDRTTGRGWNLSDSFMEPWEYGHHLQQRVEQTAIAQYVAVATSEGIPPALTFVD